MAIAFVPHKNKPITVHTWKMATVKLEKCFNAGIDDYVGAAQLILHEWEERMTEEWTTRQHYCVWQQKNCKASNVLMWK